MGRYSRILLAILLALAAAGVATLHLGLVSHTADEDHTDLGSCAVCQIAHHAAGEPQHAAVSLPDPGASEAAPTSVEFPAGSPQESPAPTRAPPVRG